MVDPSVVSHIRAYLKNLAGQGIPSPFAVVFGSYATGRTNEWSDIDLVVVSPLFDEGVSRDQVNRLWRAAARTDSRIEPIPCGEREWQTDTDRPILDIARREGTVITERDPDAGRS